MPLARKQKVGSDLLPMKDTCMTGSRWCRDLEDMRFSLSGHLYRFFWRSPSQVIVLCALPSLSALDPFACRGSACAVAEASGPPFFFSFCSHVGFSWVYFDGGDGGGCWWWILKCLFFSGMVYPVWRSSAWLSGLPFPLRVHHYLTSHVNYLSRMFMLIIPSVVSDLCIWWCAEKNNHIVTWQYNEQFSILKI